MPAPLVTAILEGPDRPLPITSEIFRDLAGVAMVIDSGPTRCAKLPTRAAIEGDHWTVEREGAVSVTNLRRMSGQIILFICTGNTCRSPMAEAICKLLIARRLDCPLDELEDRGFLVISAGVAATSGASAASHAVDVLRSMGGTLEDHRSRRLTLEMVRQADCIFAMTADHLDALLDAVPQAQPARSCSTPTAATFPTRSVLTTRTIARRPSGSSRCSRNACVRWGWGRVERGSRSVAAVPAPLFKFSSAREIRRVDDVSGGDRGRPCQFT